MQIGGSTFSNTSFLGHSQETSPLQNKTWEGLVQADLLGSMDLPMPDLGTSAGWHPSAPSSSVDYQCPALPHASLPYLRVCSAPSQFHVMKMPVWRVSLCPPAIIGGKSNAASAHSYLWDDRSIILPLWGVLGPRVALDGCSPSAFWGVRAEQDTHSPSTPHGLWGVGGHAAANTPTRCSKVQSGFSELWFFVEGTCRSS